MDLDVLANELLPPEGGEAMFIAGENCRRIQEIFESEEIATPLIATTFWQAFIFSRSFNNLFYPFGREDYPRPYPDFYRYPELFKQPSWYYKIYRHKYYYPNYYEGPTSIVLSHGTGVRKRYDLVVFLPWINRFAYPRAINRVRISREDIQSGWSNFLKSPTNLFQRTRRSGGQRRGLRDAGALIEYGAGAALEAYEAQSFGIIFTHAPQLVPTRAAVVNAALPSRAMKICQNKDDEAVATVGVVSTSRSGKFGVTTALHALSKRRKRVWVGDHKGTVLTKDTWSDSCFIEVPGPSGMGVRGSNGPLIGRTPRSNEDVTFEGVSSGKKDTIVIGWDPRLPYFEKNSQFTVITKPVTAPGDSGAALIDSDNKILGFAYSRTGFGEKVEFAAWIWAQSVFANHKLL